MCRLCLVKKLGVQLQKLRKTAITPSVFKISWGAVGYFFRSRRDLSEYVRFDMFRPCLLKKTRGAEK